MSSGDKVRVTLENGIKRIIINRPERRNALDTESMRLLREAFEASAADDSRVVILTGAGDAFSAGADLQASGQHSLLDSDVTEVLRANTNPTILAMRALDKPIIARVHGPAVGVGCNYAFACDLIVASEEAKFGQVFIKIGLMPDGGGSYFLPRMVGYHKAFELLATGEIFGAREALGYGMINRVVPAGELDAAVDEMAARLAAAPAVALRQMKRALIYGESHTLAEALDFEAVGQGACFRSEDFAEGVRAFLEKRQPVFKGR